MRTSTLLLPLFLPTILAAQVLTPSRSQKAAFPRTETSRPAHDRTNDDPLWTEDFESGLNGWTVSTEAGAVDWQLTSTGNTGGFTPGPLESTTGYPGGTWIVADSDGEGTAGTNENTTMTSPPVLGFDTVSFMLLRFEQSFRQLNDDQTLVEVSGNGGAEWTIYPVNTGIGGNMSTAGAPASEVVTLNISAALAAGSSDIRLRFRWISDEGFTYSWQVDDIALLPVSANDLVLSDAVHAVWNTGDPDYLDLPYSIYLAGETRDLHFRATIANNGSTTQNGVRLNVVAEDPSGFSIEMESAPANLAPVTSHVFDITGYTLPGDIGDYTFHLTTIQAAADDHPENNTAEITVRVDPYIFARDGGTVATQRDNDGDDYELGNRFWLDEYDRVLVAVDVALGPGTDVGSVIAASVYDENLDIVAESDFHNVTADEINDLGGDRFITLPLFDPEVLDGEETYLVCVHTFLNGDEVWTGINGISPAQTSLIYRYDVGQWFFVTTTPMVRMNFGSNIGMAEGSAPQPALVAAPSVFDEETTVSFTLASASQLRWDLRDMSGRVVRGESLGARSAGSQQVRIDGEDLAGGAYLFTMYTDQGQATLRLARQARR